MQYLNVPEHPQPNSILHRHHKVVGANEVKLTAKAKAHWLPVQTRVVAGPQVPFLGFLSSSNIQWICR